MLSACNEPTTHAPKSLFSIEKGDNSEREKEKENFVATAALFSRRKKKHTGAYFAVIVENVLYE